MNIIKWHNTKVTMLILKLVLHCIMTSQSPWFLQILHVPAYGLCQVQYSLELPHSSLVALHYTDS